MKEVSLSRMDTVDLRKIWASEATGFTPWLAQDDNIKLLGETIDIELEVTAQEREVGRFRADILCRDTVNNHWVLIENQLERTDHTHLGQLMTYAAGLDAVTIIWIAAHFTEEHRAAIDWLNRITQENINFFGLEIELWRIGDSPIAPKFNMVCKPNAGAKTVQTSAEKGELSETKKLQLEYWTQFRQLMEENQSFVRCQKPQPQHWTCFAVGRAHFHLVARVNTQAQEVAAYLCISGPEKEQHFQLLQSRHKQLVEDHMKWPLEWRELPDAKESQVVACSEADPTDRSDWHNQHVWLKGILESFHRVFSPIVKDLDASDYRTADEEGDQET